MSDALNQKDKLEVINKSLLVNGKPFVVTHPGEEMLEIQNGRLVTLFRGHLENHWEPEDIKGYYT